MQIGKDREIRIKISIPFIPCGQCPQIATTENAILFV